MARGGGDHPGFPSAKKWLAPSRAPGLFVGRMKVKCPDRGSKRGTLDATCYVAKNDVSRFFD